MFIFDVYLFWNIYKNKPSDFKVWFIVLWKKYFNSVSSVYVTSYHVVIFVEWLQYTLTHTYIFISWRKGAWRKIVFNVRVTCCCFDYIRKHKIWRIQHSIISELNVDGVFPVGYRGLQILRNYVIQSKAHLLLSRKYLHIIYQVLRNISIFLKK